VIKRVVNGVRIIAIMREVATSTSPAHIREGATLFYAGNPDSDPDLGRQT
jgi:hypothetical protein